MKDVPGPAAGSNPPMRPGRLPVGLACFRWPRECLPSTAATGAEARTLGEGGVGEALGSKAVLDSEGDAGAAGAADPTGGSWEDTGTAETDLGERGGYRRPTVWKDIKRSREHQLVFQA